MIFFVQFNRYFLRESRTYPVGLAYGHRVFFILLGKWNIAFGVQKDEECECVE